MDAKDQQLNDRMQVPASSLSQPVSVWDWPIRLFHWLLAFAVTGLVLTGLKGGDAMQQHALLGYTVLGLLSFRLLWGLVGSRNARFRHFLASPAKAWAYLRLTRDEKARWIGHSPEIAFSGPFAASVPGAWSAWATWYHKTVGKPALLLMIGLHLVAIAYYAVVLRIPLLGAMIFGSREIEK
ncbi:MAG: cytochrome B [Betaproteobacteria bacterium]|nr:cytochrome B [Betaproteobacteria bacterium]